MKIDNCSACLWTVPLGYPLTTGTPPRCPDGYKLMDGPVRPAVDALKKDTRKEAAHVWMGKGDKAGFIVAVNGMLEGFYVSQARLFALYGDKCPTFQVQPLHLEDDKAPTALCKTPEMALPTRNNAFCVTVCTPADAKPGLYRSDFEIESDAGVCYLPVVIRVGDFVVEENPAPLAEDYLGILAQKAACEKTMLQVLGKCDAKLQGILSRCLEATPHAADPARADHLREAMVRRMDGQFEIGNRQAPGRNKVRACEKGAM